MPSSRTPKQRSSSGSPARFDGAHGGRVDRFVSTDVSEDAAELVVQDAYWLRVSWRLTARTLSRAEKAFGKAWQRAIPVIRIRGLAAGESAGREPVSERDVIVPGDAAEWFVECPAESFVDAQVGYLSEGGEGRFFPMAVAETVATRAQTAPTIAPDAGLPDDVLAELQQLRTGRAKFTFDIEAEIVLRGRTSPGAEIGVGEDVLKADGQGDFEYRRPLENGRTVLPIEARSEAGHDSRSGVASTDFNLRILEANDHEE